MDEGYYGFGRCSNYSFEELRVITYKHHEGGSCSTLSLPSPQPLYPDKSEDKETPNVFLGLLRKNHRRNMPLCEGKKKMKMKWLLRFFFPLRRKDFKPHLGVQFWDCRFRIDRPEPATLSGPQKCSFWVCEFSALYRRDWISGGKEKKKKKQEQVSTLVHATALLFDGSLKVLK